MSIKYNYEFWKEERKRLEEKERKFIKDNGIRKVKITIDAEDEDDDELIIFELDKYNNLYMTPLDNEGEYSSRIKIGNLERFIKELTNK